MKFECIGVPKSLNILLRMHYWARKKERNNWSTKILIGLNQANYHYPYPYFEKAKVEIVQYRHRLLDPDNLKGSIKLIIDCLTKPIGMKKYGYSILKDDREKHLILEVTQTTIPMKEEEYTIIKIEEVPDEDK